MVNTTDLMLTKDMIAGDIITHGDPLEIRTPDTLIKSQDGKLYRPHYITHVAASARAAARIPPSTWVYTRAVREKLL